MTQNQTPRLFTAIALPDPVRQELARLQTLNHAQGQGPEITWQQPRNLHITLNFIGAVDRAHLPGLSEALASIQHPTFSLSLEGVGCFGSATQPRVLWAGITTSSTLHTLQQQALNALKNVGFQPDEKPYHPHVTLGRCRPNERRAETAVNWVSEHTDYQGPTFEVNQFCLFGSTRDDEGLRYDVVDTFGLED